MNNRNGIHWQVFALLAVLAACDSTASFLNGNKGNSGKGGSSGAGGKIGGSSGSQASGGSAGAGHVVATGGTPSVGTGGASAAGGPNGNGGASSVGGASGANPTGGASGSGGVSAAGGASANGGTNAAGGATGFGGGNATGGSSASGGSSGTGGGAGGTGGSAVSKCALCHGDSATNNPAPPQDTAGNSDTASPGVGAHAMHLAASAWHRQGKCVDCHTVPTSTSHANGKVDFTWGAPSNASSANPNFDAAALTCADAYCHGSTLAGSSLAKTLPVWNQVDGSWNACGSACHATPPPASTGHPASTACETCHSKVIASFAANSPSTTWKDPTLHINGTVEVDTLTCTSCHGSGTNPAPPKDTQGATATTAAGVGAHAQHLAVSTWHRQGQCADCHATPTSTLHANNKVDFAWAAPSNANGAAPSFNPSALSCSGTYCHGAKMTDQSSNVGRVPVWNKVDGTHDACGKACHATPPAGGSHSASTTACQNCHGDVIASFNGANSTWKNASLHMNGKVEATAMTCTSCHGNPPNSGTHTRREHKVACTNCHPDPGGTTHRNAKTDTTCGSSQNGCHGED